jgi:hypothetical protein
MLQAEGENNDKFDTHPNTPGKIRQYLRAHSTSVTTLVPSSRSMFLENGDFNKKSKFLNVHQRKNLR